MPTTPARDRPDQPSALIIGASSAIGRAIAVELADLAYDTQLWGRDPERLAQTRADCEAAGGSSQVTRVDVLDQVSIRAGVAAMAAATRLQVLVYAAGVFDWADAAEAPPASKTVIDTNLTGAILTSQLMLPSLVANAPASLIFVGSGAAKQAFPHNAAYVASKHGLAGYARSVFLEVRDQGVKVSLVNPGLVLAGAGLYAPAASAHPERLLQPADVAAAVRFIVTFPSRGCPLEIDLQPQHSP